MSASKTAVCCSWMLVWLLAAQTGAAADAADQKKENFPLTSQFSTLELDVSTDNASSCPTQHQRSIARDLISKEVRSRLPGIPQKLIPCDQYHIGKLPHCAVENCSILFQQTLNDSRLILFSGVYWLKLPGHSPEKVYCNRETEYPEVSSCRLLFSYHPTAQSGYHTLLLQNGVRLEVYCDRDSGLPQPESCGQAHQLELPSGYYSLRPPPSNLPLNHTVFCNMNHEECGADGEWWTHIASLNMSDIDTPCPSNWSLITDPIRGCSRSTPTQSGCDSVKFPSLGHTYTKVCGRVRAHQSGRAFGFWPIIGRNQDLDGAYLSGVSITHGDTPRTHVWSFAASLGIFYCPCAPEYQSSPETLMGNDSFVGDHYFCEIGIQGEEPEDGTFDLDDPLWDGTTCSEGDSCCLFNNPPWFTRDLPGPTTDDIEVRICGISPVEMASTPVSLLDIFIH